MTYTFKVGNTVKTRDGHSAHIIITDVNGDYPMAAVITHSDGTESIFVYTAEGKRHLNLLHDFDLMPPAPRTLSVRFLAYYHRNTKALMWYSEEDSSLSEHWRRVPSADRTEEVEHE